MEEKKDLMSVFLLFEDPRYISSSIKILNHQYQQHLQCLLWCHQIPTRHFFPALFQLFIQ